MARVVAGRVGEIQPGERKIVVPFRGRAGVGVFNVGGTLYALRNICPHKIGPLCTGRITGRIQADAPPSAAGGVPSFAHDGEIIRCPWHQWEYEIATGRCLVDSRVHAKTYPVKIENGHIIVEYDD